MYEEGGTTRYGSKKILAIIRDYRVMNMGRGFGRPEGFSSIRVSSDFTQNVTNIAQNDLDVQNLLSQDHNTPSVRPVISTVIDGNDNTVCQSLKSNKSFSS